MSRTRSFCTVLALAALAAGCTTTVSTTPLPPGSTCAPDDTVSGCAAPSAGYSCTGSDTPADSNPDLACSVPVQGNAGSLLYCCLSPTFSSSCAPDGTVAGCVGGSFGFSCTGSDSPDATDSTLVCSAGVQGNAGSTLYCCTD